MVPLSAAYFSFKTLNLSVSKIFGKNYQTNRKTINLSTTDIITKTSDLF